MVKATELLDIKKLRAREKLREKLIKDQDISKELIYRLNELEKLN